MNHSEQTASRMMGARMIGGTSRISSSRMFLGSPMNTDQSRRKVYKTVRNETIIITTRIIQESILLCIHTAVRIASLDRNPENKGIPARDAPLITKAIRSEEH